MIRQVPSFPIATRSYGRPMRRQACAGILETIACNLCEQHRDHSRLCRQSGDDNPTAAVERPVGQ